MQTVTKLLVWARRPGETSRHTATEVLAYSMVSQIRSARALAHEIDAIGAAAVHAAVERGEIVPVAGDSTSLPVSGHGVTIVYPTGRRCTVRA